MKDIFLLWNLIIKLATLKGGDDGSAGSDPDGNGMSDTEENAANTDAAFGTNYSDRLNSDGTFSNSPNNTSNLDFGSFKELERELGLDGVDDSSTFGGDGDGYDLGISDVEVTTDWSNWDMSQEVTNSWDSHAYDWNGEVISIDGTRTDTHYTLNKTGMNKVGFVTEVALDIMDMANISYSKEFVAGFEIASSIVSLGMTMMSIPTSMALLGNIGKLSTLGQIATAVKVGADIYTTIDSLERIQSHAATLGYDLNSQEKNSLSSYHTGMSSLNSSLDFYGDDKGSGSYALDYAANTGLDYSSSSIYIKEKLDSMISLEVYSKMAGGLLFNETFAGGDVFDASRRPSLNLSIGKKYTLTDHAKSVHYPYENLAGGKFF